MRKIIVCLLGLSVFTLNSSCTTIAENTLENPFLLHIGDGRVYLEKSHHHLVNDRRGMASEKWNSFVYFQPMQTTLPGKVWASDSGPYEEVLGADTSCEIRTEKSHYEKATPKTNPTALVKVKVKDGLKNGPFDTVINGESEGEIQFGEYPLKDWKAVENLTLDETLIKEWSYDKKTKLYKITKKMGENQYLKKEIKIGHQIRSISSVKYEILEEQPGFGDEPAKLVPLARLTCGGGF